MDNIRAKDIADAIIRNELERRESITQQPIPDARQLQLAPAGKPPRGWDFNGVPPDNSWAPNIMKQLVGDRRGGDT